MEYNIRFDVMPTLLGIVYRRIEANNEKEALEAAKGLIAGDSEEFDDDINDYLHAVGATVSVSGVEGEAIK